MNYQYEFHIPARTSDLSPVIMEIKPLNGFLISGEIFFPPGCRNQVGIKVLANGYSQIAPPDYGWITGDGPPPIVFTYGRRLEGPSYLIILQGYNKAIDWEHTPKITLRLER